MKLLILTGGVWPHDTRVQSLVHGCEFIICCDGAAKDARRLGIMPNMLVGDMDSVSEEDRAYMLAHGVQEAHLPREKDQTDTQVACEIAIEQGSRSVAIIGGLGGRTDHSMGNIQCLWMLHDEGVDARMESGDELAMVVTSECRLGCHTGCTFSLIPLLPQTVVFSMTGVAYPLRQVSLPLGSTLGVSNVVLSQQALLSLQSGAALLIVNLMEV